MLFPAVAKAAEPKRERTQRPGLLGRRSNRGQAVIEVALLAPWIFFLFIGTLDMGFYWHAIIATQNAARAAAAHTSRTALTAADNVGACIYALEEMKAMNNVRTLSNCNAMPLTVTATAVTGADGSPASSVSVTYRTNRLIPIPGLIGQLAITRSVEMMVK
jgi:Flp pilus assembly protein TadG